MGQTPSVPEPPPINYDPTALRAVLTERGSPTAVIFVNAGRFRDAAETGESSAACELTCSSPAGYSLVQKTPTPRGPYNVDGASWSVFDCVISSNAKAGAKCTFDAGYLQRPHDTRVLNVSEWKYEPGMGIEFIRDRRDAIGHGKTRMNHGKQGGRGWLFHPDGTLAPIDAPHLVIGWEYPDITLVTRGAPDACIFEHAAGLAAGGDQSSPGHPLTLKSHPGLAVVPKSDPRRIDVWGVSYQHLGLGAASQAIPMVLERGHTGSDQFLLSRHQTSASFVLDVPFDKRSPGCNGLPLAVILFDNGKNKEHGNKARLWTINADGTISPSKSPNLVIGVRPGSAQTISVFPMSATAPPPAGADGPSFGAPPSYSEVMPSAPPSEKAMFKADGTFR